MRSLLFVMSFWFFSYLDYHLMWFLLLYREDMALESCEGGELFDQITRVSWCKKFIACIHCRIISDLSKENYCGHFCFLGVWDWDKQVEKHKNVFFYLISSFDATHTTVGTFYSCLHLVSEKHKNAFFKWCQQWQCCWSTWERGDQERVWGYEGARSVFFYNMSCQWNLKRRKSH